MGCTLPVTGCEANDIRALARVAEEDRPADVMAAIPTYESLTTTWTVWYSCGASRDTSTGTMEMVLEPADDLLVVVGPLPGVHPSDAEHCDYLARGAGTVTFTGTPDAGVNGLAIPVTIYLEHTDGFAVRAPLNLPAGENGHYVGSLSVGFDEHNLPGGQIRSSGPGGQICYF
jgi:hypothetical protein